jgi:tetratricopeptide (TPR) repeat protein
MIGDRANGSLDAIYCGIAEVGIGAPFVSENVTVPRKAKADSKKELSYRLQFLLCLLMLVIYGNTFGLGFALDAVGIVQGDPRVHALTAENLTHIFQYDYWWPSSVDTLYRPVTTLSFLFNYAVLGNADNAAGYHVLNVLLHMANVVLVFQLASRLLGDRAPAFFAAALWSVHPVLTESVANIAGRADLLATVAVLGGLLLYDRILNAERWRGSVAGLFVVALFGVLSKESAAVLFGFMLLWDLVCGAGWIGGGKRRAAAYSAVVGALAIMLAARFAVFASAPVPEMPFVDNPLRGAGFLIARWTAIKMVGMDLLLLVWPLHLSSERGFAQIVPAAFGDLGAWLAFAVSSAILAAVVVRYRKDRPLFCAAGMFAIALLPVSNLVFLIGATLAERFLYLPSVGFAIAAAVLLYRLKERIPVRTVAILLVTLLAVRTFARNLDWKNNLTLAQADVSNAPRSARLQEMLASSLFAQDPAQNLDAAIAHGEAAWEILRVLPPGRIYQQTPARLGAYYRMKGDAVGAPANREWYQKSAVLLERARESSQAIEKAYDQAQLAGGRPLATRVAYQPLYRDLGLAYLKLGRYGEAVNALRYGREVDPRTPLLYDLLAAAYSADRQPRQAAATVLEKVLLLGANSEALAQVGRIYGEGSCAIVRGAGWVRLNEECPQIRPDLCLAEVDLVELLGKARLPEMSMQFAKGALKSGCNEKSPR